VLAGPVRWNSIGRSARSSCPPTDPRLLVTVHHYEPFAFTHQGAEWVDPSPPVGTEWTGTETGIASPWDNWSWGTAVTPGDGGITVEYQQGWAGLYFRRGSRLADPVRLGFTADAAIGLNVIAGNDENDQAFPVQTVAGEEMIVDLPAAFLPVERVMLQNATPDARPAFVLSGAWIETADGSREPMLATARDELMIAMRRASAWGRARGLPVHLGEFGAYSARDMDSRVRWTRAVRESAERAGLAWSYWELAAGFGFYDPDAGVFREGLLDALVH
jgi:endoglucanase